MFNSAMQAYETGGKATASTRDLEAAALFKAARLLESCRMNLESADWKTRMAQALQYNQRLWTFFQAELAEPEHPLEPRLRADLLQLSSFVDRRTFELMADPDPAGLQVLIEIDRSIAAGLSARTG
ncbi:MAG: flagellar biosynthesis regulator FlaF [Gemmatimonadales bacterium]